jgi:hypothetical protein
MTDKTTCASCHAPARSLAAAGCRAADCPLNSANLQKPAAAPSTPVDPEADWYGDGAYGGMYGLFR